MTTVITYGLISVVPLIFGAWLGTVLKIKEKYVGVISAFGAGALIAALTFGLMEEAFSLGGLDHSVLGFLAGGIVFAIGDLIILKIGGRGHKDTYDSNDTTGWGIVLGAVLDGLPESIALGIGLFLNPKMGLLLLLAIIFSNLPEAIASAYDLRRIHKSAKKIIITWSFVALLTFIMVILGYVLFGHMSSSVAALLESFAAGAIMAMLAVTMMPEAYKESGVGASLATVFGFLIIFALSRAGV